MPSRNVRPDLSVSRRTWLHGSVGVLISAEIDGRTALAHGQQVQGGAGQQAALVDHPGGAFRFLPGIAAYSAGVVAADGYEIVHAVFSRPLTLDDGFQAIDRRLKAERAPNTALCALELRSPRPLTTEGFKAFNVRYAAHLDSRGILLPNGRNPVARTNVAPVLFPPPEAAIHAFSYVVRASRARPSFVVAGAGELPDGSIDSNDIIRRGDTSPGATAEKARYVLSRMTARLHGLGVSWADVTSVNVYTVQDLGRELTSELLTAAKQNGFTWNYARPPIAGLEFEMDVRGVRNELVLG